MHDFQTRGKLDIHQEHMHLDRKINQIKPYYLEWALLLIGVHQTSCWLQGATAYYQHDQNLITYKYPKNITNQTEV
jgi:hypothetical protein